MSGYEDERNSAEATKFLAEADMIKQRTTFAELMNKKSIERADLTLRQFEAEVYIKETEAESVKRMRELSEASDINNHRYLFIGEVSYQGVVDCLGRLDAWSRIDPTCEMEVVITTPGGDIVAGMMLFDSIRMLTRAGHKITTTAMGQAASMGSVLVQAGSTRAMAQESWLLIHEGSFGGQGSSGVMKDTVEWFTRLQGRILDIFAKGCTDAGDEATERLTRNDIETRWSRKEWWINADEALKFGLIDKIV